MCQVHYSSNETNGIERWQFTPPLFEETLVGATWHELPKVYWVEFWYGVKWYLSSKSIIYFYYYKKLSSIGIKIKVARGNIQDNPILHNSIIYLVLWWSIWWIPDLPCQMSLQANIYIELEKQNSSTYSAMKINVEPTFFIIEICI